MSVAGHYDVAVNDQTRYDMARAELHMAGGGGGPRTFELMSKDIGPDPLGLDRTLPGHYPIGALRIGPGALTLQFVDSHDNDGLGQAACEALYVRTLVIESGATLNTGNCRVYYQALINNGSVDDLSHLVAICQKIVPPDFDTDCDVDQADFEVLRGCVSGPSIPWADPACQKADLDGDGDVDQLDFGIFQRCYSGFGRPVDPACTG